MAKHCCERMAAALAQSCDQHPDPYDCPDNLITQVRGGYGLIVHDGGRSFVAISYCPWCGGKLPPVGEIDLSKLGPE